MSPAVVKILASPTVAAFTQECLNCRLALLMGEIAFPGAVNCFTGDPVWMHPGCAVWYRTRFGDREVLDDGWRLATFHQTCACGHRVVTNDKIYRRFSWAPNLTGSDATDPVLTWVCHSCWRRDHPTRFA
jgi:hypothetical protein